MNLPIDFQNQMKELLGEAYDAFVKEYDKPYFSALRVNTRKISIEKLCELIGKSERVPWENRGLYYTDIKSTSKDVKENDTFRPGKSPYHEAGLYYIQEPSAMLPVTLLDIDMSSGGKFDEGVEHAEDMKVLDLCAAPGGKTTQIADYMGGRGLLVANEIVPQRAKILSENIERMGVKNAIVISADPRDLSDRFVGFFDRILVDAPCSGEGMFRKHPEAMEEWSLASVDECADRQAWVMDCAATMLKHGGRMVYSTCTFNEKEDEESVKNFLERHPEFSLAENGMHRIYPHLHDGEGHFGAVLVKDGGHIRTDGVIEAATKGKKRSGEKAAREDSFKPYFDFIEKNLTPKGIDKLKEYAENGIYLMFGDNLYLAPGSTPRLSGLKVLRPGLHLGTVIKNRFEPSHALALYLNSEDAIRTCDCSIKDAVRYLKGETLSLEEENNTQTNGWMLVLADGYSIGWAKNTNGMLKNHYPKGLRWM